MNQPLTFDDPPLDPSATGLSWTLSALMKGVPQAFDGLRREEVAARAASVPAQDLPFPVATLRRSALRSNGELRCWGYELSDETLAIMAERHVALVLTRVAPDIACARHQ